MKTGVAGTLFAVLMNIGLPAVVRPAIVLVPDEQPTILAGIAAAQPSDTVLIRAGTYFEHDIELRDGITVMGEVRGELAVTIDAMGLGRVMYADNPTEMPMHACVQGIIFSNGAANEGGGICATGSDVGFDLDITDCAFKANGATRGGGIHIDASSANLRECRFSENKAQNGGGIAGSGWNWDHSISVISCEFVDNYAEQAGGAIAISMANLDLTDCAFRDNRAQSGGAVYSSNYNGRVCCMLRCSFDRNRAALGGALHSMEDVLLLADCLFVENAAEQGGAAWIAYPRDAAVRNCTLARNIAETGSGICLSEQAFLPLEHSILAFGQDGSALACVNGLVLGPELACCDVFGNAGGDWVGCIAGQGGNEGNFSADPRFCLDLEPDQPYALQTNSPCAQANNPECGQVGAFAVGCGTTAAAATSFSAIKAMY